MTYHVYSCYFGLKKASSNNYSPNSNMGSKIYNDPVGTNNLSVQNSSDLINSN